MTKDGLTDWLRRRVLGLIHVGRAGPGARLPSIREMSRLSGADHRAVAEAYRVLEGEGLVEVRAASGVYVSERVEGGGVPASGSGRWLVDMLCEGWAQRLSADLMYEATLSMLVEPFRAVCIDSVEDTRLAMSAELEQDFGMLVTDLKPTELAEIASSGEDPGCDVVVTSVFHATEACAFAADRGAPCVVVQVHEEFAAELDRLLREATAITLVAVDPGMIDRMHRYLAVTAHSGKAAGITLDELGSDGIDGLAGQTVVTRAARRRLGLEDYHMLMPPAPYIAAASARELWQAMAQCRLDRGMKRGPSPGALA